jgi:hypothetical protein
LRTRRGSASAPAIAIAAGEGTGRNGLVSSTLLTK